jgi:hypothetical protein
MQAALSFPRISIRSLVVITATAAVLFIGATAGYLLRGLGPTVETARAAASPAASVTIVTASGPAFDSGARRSGTQY